eukprot:TRINITY_DN21473_c0_g1_i1.p1 TRINITY_DN21473_c0_g1~~TRINITY_DN21473_c0_g1_i1.p1  ORF type:complete len:241 (+),score=41.09 TRINITY_DN21473_c0_g1_i1:355-1077(+)
MLRSVKSLIAKATRAPTMQFASHYSYSHLTSAVRFSARPDFKALPTFSIKASKRQFHISRQLGNHYKVLEIDQNATKDEVKQAYLALSKRFHPDSNASADEETRKKAHKRFIKIRKAFDVLHNSGSRQAYDTDLFRSQGFTTHETYQRPTYEYPEYQTFHGQSPYQMVSNSTVVLLIVGWTILGIVWHYFAISKTKTELEQFLEARSQAAAENHAIARQRAKENGYKKQLELLRMKVAPE